MEEIIKNEKKDEETTPKHFNPDEMSDEMKQYVASQIALAVESTKEKVLSDPETIATIKKQIEGESKKTLEEKVAEKLAQLTRKENEIEARSIFAKGNIPEELIDTYVSLSIDDDSEKTKSKANNLVEAYTKAFNKGKDLGLDTQKKNLNPPNVGGDKGGTKAFKDMSMEERIELKKNNPKKFEEELQKLQNRF